MLTTEHETNYPYQNYGFICVVTLAVSKRFYLQLTFQFVAFLDHTVNFRLHTRQKFGTK